MEDVESLNHTKWECKYHVVFIPKYRRKALYEKLRSHLSPMSKTESPRLCRRMRYWPYRPRRRIFGQIELPVPPPALTEGTGEFDTRSQKQTASCRRVEDWLPLYRIAPFSGLVTSTLAMPSWHPDERAHTKLITIGRVAAAAWT